MNRNAAVWSHAGSGVAGAGRARAYAPLGRPRASCSSGTRFCRTPFPGRRSGRCAPRFYAMTHIAMFDAVNAIEREFDPYRVRLRHRGGGSPDAAAAQAAHDVLAALNPPAARAYDAALARQLGTTPSSFVRRGAAVGALVAKEILAWRQNDGWVVRQFSSLCRAASSRTLAADAAEQSRPRHSPIFRTPRRWRC